MAAIPVRVEPPGENPVVEVSYDGQEVSISRSFYDYEFVGNIIIRR